MEICEKNKKEFSLYDNYNFCSYVLKFLGIKDGDNNIYSSSMHKEIFEQPEILENLVNVFINNEFNFNLDSNIKKVKFVASGSSYHCALLGVYMFNKFTSIDADSFYSGEFMLNKNKNYSNDTLFVFISQSGETYDTLECLKFIKNTNAKTLCITNSEDSSLYSMCDYKLLSIAGVEKSIASTKALSAQIFCLFLLAMNYCDDNEVKSEKIEKLKLLPQKVKKILLREKELNKIVNVIKRNKSLVLLGAKECYALAKEGGLKIKETSYINTTAYPMGEFLHGHVAVLNKKIPVLSAITNENYYQQLRVIRKIREDYNPFIITIGANKKEKDIRQLSNICIDIDEEDYITRIFLILIIYQLIALKIATVLKMNIDKPKGLKKVVN